MRKKTLSLTNTSFDFFSSMPLPFGSPKLRIHQSKNFKIYPKSPPSACSFQMTLVDHLYEKTKVLLVDDYLPYYVLNILTESPYLRTVSTIWLPLPVVSKTMKYILQSRFIHRVVPYLSNDIVITTCYKPV